VKIKAYQEKWGLKKRKDGYDAGVYDYSIDEEVLYDQFQENT